MIQNENPVNIITNLNLLRNQLGELSKQLNTILEKTSKLQPSNSKHVLDENSLDIYKLAETIRCIEALIENSSQKLRALTRLSAWIDKHKYPREFKAGVCSYIIHYDRISEQHICSNSKFYKPDYAFYLTQEGAEAAVKALNSGTLVL